MRPRLFIILILLTAPIAGQENVELPACADGIQNKKTLGQRLRFEVPKGAKLKRGKDIDYVDYNVGFGKGTERVWMHGIHGSNASGGKVSSELLDTNIISQRIWKSEGIEMVDARGTLTNGHYWRFIGIFGEQVAYKNVPKDAADYFDRMLDTICYLSWERIP
jgi:hypothetical protein